jgi:hypothetical protein
MFLNKTVCNFTSGKLVDDLQSIYQESCQYLLKEIIDEKLGKPIAIEPKEKKRIPRSQNLDGYGIVFVHFVTLDESS